MQLYMRCSPIHVHFLIEVFKYLILLTLRIIPAESFRIKSKLTQRSPILRPIALEVPAAYAAESVIKYAKGNLCELLRMGTCLTCLRDVVFVVNISSC